MAVLSARAKQMAWAHIRDYGTKTARQVTNKLQRALDSNIGIPEVRNYLNSLVSEGKLLKKKQGSVWYYSINRSYTKPANVKKSKEKKKTMLTVAAIQGVLGNNALTAKEIANALGGGITQEEVRIFISPHIGSPVGSKGHGPFWSFRKWQKTRYQVYRKP